ncbi:MFS transporter [Acinetobacter gerneri]|uniref:MFS transporter n=1 Tax=Acinetobacter gerneri TaxID=202952 RepID=UPI0028B008C3|nr:MFS transporter [Acinetobacter gerneri]
MKSISNQSQAILTERLPIAALLALAMTGFICIVTETLPAGLLPEISMTMHISQAYAGQMVTSYAIGSLMAAIPLTIATRGWPRRRVLLLTIAGFFTFNSITALSHDYILTLIARFFAGASAGLAWSLLAGYARRMVAPHQQGRALAVAMIGTPIALSLGVPMGTFLGGFIGWRIVFWIMSGLALILMLWVILKVPNYPGQKVHESMPLKKVFTTLGVRPILAVVITWMLAHNMLYTYIAPFIASAGINQRIDLVLLAFGIASLFGIWITSQLIDRYLRTTILLSLAAFSFTAIVLGLATHISMIVYVCVVIWGVTFGGAATLLQTALADAAGRGADVALSMNVVVWNLAIALAGVTGGLLLDLLGVWIFPWVITILVMVAFIIAYFSRCYAFKSGPRDA